MAHRNLLCCLLAMGAWCSSASAIEPLCSSASRFGPFAEAWEAKYPLSTLPARMQALTDSDCNVCHHSQPGVLGNCYREDLSDLFALGMSPADAIDQLDTVDSDGDGVPNGVEIMTPRAGEPGEIGYNPGLVGDTGVDPCGDPPNEVVTGVPETPPPPLVPTVSEWGLIVLTLLGMTAGTILLARRHRPAAAVSLNQPG